MEKTYALGVDLEKSREVMSSGEEGTGGGRPSMGCGYSSLPT